MNYIDVIEGVGRSVISELLKIFTKERLDDTEHIRNIRALIDGIDLFIKEHPETIDDPIVLKQVLYDFSKASWLHNLNETRQVAPNAQGDIKKLADDGYDGYYFDYIYNHGEYPR